MSTPSKEPPQPEGGAIRRLDDKADFDGKLPFKEKLAYGMGDIGNRISAIPKAMSGQVFVMHLGMSPIYMTITSTIFSLWDAISDPIMGSFSDNFRSRFGRRRPFIILGALLSALMLPLLFLFDSAWSPALIISYFVVLGILFYTADTIFNMPYQSLLLEMTPDYDERTSVAAYRGFLSKIGQFFIGWIWAFTQLPIFFNEMTGEADTLAGMRAASIVAALVILFFSPLPAIFCKERYYNLAKGQVKKPFFSGLKKTLSCKPFVVLLGFVLAFQGTHTAISAFGPFLLNYYVFSGDQGAASIMHGWGSSLATVAGLVAVPLVVRYSRRTSKEHLIWFVLISKVLLSVSLWFCFDPERPWLSIIPNLFNAPIMTAAWILLPAMLADVVDVDELSTGERREGNFSSIFSWNVKASITVGTALSGPLLIASGFDAALGSNQTSDALFNMRMLMVSIPLIGALLCLILLKFYPINPTSARALRAKLEERRGKVGN